MPTGCDVGRMHCLWLENFLPDNPMACVWLPEGCPILELYNGIKVVPLDSWLVSFWSLALSGNIRNIRYLHVSRRGNGYSY